MQNQALFLIVEDNGDDALLLRLAFSKARILNPVQVVRSGEEAVSYLLGTGKYANRAEFPLPQLILLDLNMPGMSGIEFLRWIRSDPDYRTLRVIVLSGSDAIRDINAAYEAGANSFLVKPADLDQFVEISKALSGYWIWTEHAAVVQASELALVIGLEDLGRRPIPQARPNV